MKIETKFDIGQEVYYIEEYYNESDDYIKEIRIGIIDKISITEYRTLFWVDGDSYYEFELFATREEAEARLEELNKLC